jgi:hypothetical protein
MWHCPHCGAPQAETARCWVCRRSSTTCSTCKHFRRSVAADLSYCALDRRRQPLNGLELRGCWEAAAAGAAPEPRAAIVPLESLSRVPRRAFVPLDTVTASPDAAAAAIEPAFLDRGEGWSGGPTLFGEPEG